MSWGLLSARLLQQQQPQFVDNRFTNAPPAVQSALLRTQLPTTGGIGFSNFTPAQADTDLVNSWLNKTGQFAPQPAVQQPAPPPAPTPLPVTPSPVAQAIAGPAAVAQPALPTPMQQPAVAPLTGPTTQIPQPAPAMQAQQVNPIAQMIAEGPTITSGVMQPVGQTNMGYNQMQPSPGMQQMQPRFNPGMSQQYMTGTGLFSDKRLKKNIKRLK